LDILRWKIISLCWRWVRTSYSCYINAPFGWQVSCSHYELQYVFKADLSMCRCAFSFILQKPCIHVILYLCRCTHNTKQLENYRLLPGNLPAMGLISIVAQTSHWHQAHRANLTGYNRDTNCDHVFFIDIIQTNQDHKW